MEAAQRMAISKGATAREPFAAALRKAGYTQNGLAKALGVSKGLLSRHRMPRSNPQSLPIPEARALRIQDLTGWPATAKGWPAGIS